MQDVEPNMSDKSKCRTRGLLHNLPISREFRLVKEVVFLIAAKPADNVSSISSEDVV